MENILQLNDEIAILEEMRHFVKGCVGEKRFAHILRVEEEAVAMAKIFLPDKIFDIRVAAIFHDVTKDIYFEEQLQLCKKFDIILNKCVGKPTIHALTGAFFAKDKYPQYVTSEIFNAIKSHTTGSVGMSVFAKIIFVADYIEAGRTYEKCIRTREKFWSFSWNCSERERAEHLNDVCLEILDNTLNFLIDNKLVIDTETLDARNSLITEKI